MNYYERHIGDYLKDTAHLSLLEHGVYGRLLDVYYTREDAIPVHQVERLIGVRSKDERAALSAVLAEFFTMDGDTLRHRRCDREIAKYQDKQRKASASANARWSKSAAHTERNADAMRTHCEGNAPKHQTPDTSNQTPEIQHPPTPRRSRGSAGLPGFDAFWSAYPRHTARATAEKAFEKLAPSADLLDEIVAAVRAQACWPAWQRDGGAYIPHAATWLNGRRWEDEKPPVSMVEPFESPKARAARESVEAMTGGLVSIRPRRAPQPETVDVGSNFLALG